MLKKGKQNNQLLYVVVALIISMYILPLFFLEASSMITGGIMMILTFIVSLLWRVYFRFCLGSTVLLGIAIVPMIIIYLNATVVFYVMMYVICQLLGSLAGRLIMQKDDT